MGGQPRVFSVDETGALTCDEPCLVVVNISCDMSDILPVKHHTKKRGYRFRKEMPKRNFRFVVIYPEMLNVAQDVFGPSTRYETSLNGDFHEFVLRAAATDQLLYRAGFDPRRDTAVIAGYFSTTILRNTLVDFMSRLRDEPVDRSSLRCIKGADKKIPACIHADETAYCLRDKYPMFEDKRVPFTNDDILSMGDYLHMGIRRNRHPPYVNSSAARVH
jgi:hypothetical protein